MSTERVRLAESLLSFFELSCSALSETELRQGSMERLEPHGITACQRRHHRRSQPRRRSWARSIAASAKSTWRGPKAILASASFIE